MTTKSILCFGDSLTWGWVPVSEAVPTTRYAPEVRWTGVMAAALGEGYHVIEEGLSARTTNADDPTDPRLNASTYLPSALARGRHPDSPHPPRRIQNRRLQPGDFASKYR